MSILENFRSAVEIEQQKNNEAYQEQIRLPVSERVDKGIAIANVRVRFEFHDEAPNPWCPSIGDGQKFIAAAHVYCKNNVSKFREGTNVFLSNGRHKFPMSVEEDTIDHFILKPNDFDVKHCYIDAYVYPENNWEINSVNSSITRKLLLQTATNLENDPGKLEIIESVFNGTVSNSRIHNSRFNLLNTSQNEAINNAYSAESFHLIQGPPGTGKTLTIAHIAKQFLEDGKKIFITAPTHTAINHCLNAISEIIKDSSKVVKIGEKYQAFEILNNNHITRKTRLPKDRYELNGDLSQEGIIVGGTPYSLCYPASKRLNNWHFDIAFIDEAAQMSIPLAISVMSKSSKFVFVGDHKQLDPIMPVGTGNPMFSESVFRKLVNLYPDEVTLLDTSYRLNNNLIRIPNELFYHNKLKSDTSINSGSSVLESDKYSEILNNDDSKILYLHKEFDSQGRSEHEANIVAELVKDLVDNGVELDEIGIVTPYRAQVREIKKAVNRQIGNARPDYTDALFIDTVDSMQGQERNYIIYSMSNSHPLESKRRLDFFYSPNRLNVAITRAIKRCIVIANYKAFDINDDELSDIPEYAQIKPSLDIFKRYYNLATKIEEADAEVDLW